MIIRKIEPLKAQRKLWVGAYARVSTEKFDQLESFETQSGYYESFIRSNPRWEFAGVYADPGRSGTSAENRPDFQRMIGDAKAGKIDVILVKSISRFARNVSDAQRYVHMLREHDVEVRFEKEAISSFAPSADFLFSVLAAVAQEESRNISENVKWSYRRNAEKGIRKIGGHKVLGFDEKDGVLIPNEDAWMIKQAFIDYAAGFPLSKVVERLNTAGARTLYGNPFAVQNLQFMLENELYVGDKRIQKQAPKDFLTKPAHSVPYASRLVRDDHEGIVDRLTWDRVQARRAEAREYSAAGVHARGSAHFLYGRVFCADCGAPYKRRTICGQDGKQILWNCADRQKGKRGNGCKNRNIGEDEVLTAISDSLGWEWISAEAFDVWGFEQLIMRVEIGADGIKVLKCEAA